MRLAVKRGDNAWKLSSAALTTALARCKLFVSFSFSSLFTWEPNTTEAAESLTEFARFTESVPAQSWCQGRRKLLYMSVAPHQRPTMKLRCESGRQTQRAEWKKNTFPTRQNMRA